MIFSFVAVSSISSSVQFICVISIRFRVCLIIFASFLISWSVALAGR